MEKLPVKLIALDLDDTLLNSETKVSEHNIEVLRECVNREIYVVLCSGRPEGGIMPFVEQLNIAESEFGRYMIAINGCSVFDIQKHQQIFNASVPMDILLHVNELTEKFGLHTEVYTPDSVIYPVETKWTVLDPVLNKVKGVLEPNYIELLKTKPFPKMLIAGEPERLLELQSILKAELGDVASIFTSKPFFLEVQNKNNGKGQAIQWLANHIGIPQNTMAFGDSMNDETMIRMCRWGVCMKNGIEPIKKIADFVTDKTNDESGVGNFIEKFVL